MTEIPTGPNVGLPQRLHQIKQAETTVSSNNKKIPLSPSSRLHTSSEKEQPTNGLSTSSTDGLSPQITSTIQLSRPFLTRQQIKFAHSKTVENLSIYNQRLLQLHSYLLKICHAFKFPMRVLEGAMYYYQRYYLHNKFEKNATTGLNPVDIGITCLFIVSKNEDTIKKLRDLLLLFNQIRGVNLPSEHFENYRKRILNVEFHILETIAFDFRTYHSEEYLVKYNKAMKITKDASYISWLLLNDTFQTDVSLKYPPHIIAIGCIIINNKLTDATLKLITDYKKYRCDVKLVNECIHDILTHYVDNFKLTGLAIKFPDHQIKFVHIKMEFNDSKPLLLTEDDLSPMDLANDQFFNERDFTNGERRYMLENQKKRLYAEVDK